MIEDENKIDRIDSLVFGRTACRVELPLFVNSMIGA
jgi:hypothetical protein